MSQILDKHIEESTELPGIEQYNKELDEAETEFENGYFITHEEMIQEIKKW
ncbi:MAG: hypothetical protein ACHQD8_05385 [Chitinophagales bacterium]